MKFDNKKHDNYQLAKDIQRLEDGMTIQTSINERHAKAVRSTGWALIMLSAAGYMILDWVCKLEKRVKDLEKKTKELTDEE